MNQKQLVVVIGGGAAGYFAAISVASQYPNTEIIILEKSLQVLGKVKVSGGGRCNVTNGSKSINELAKGYPRGEKFLKNLFQKFNNQDTIKWFENRGIKLKTEADGRVFPTTDSSQTIIDCLVDECHKLGISVRNGDGAKTINVNEDGKITVNALISKTLVADKVIVCSGGSSQKNSYQWIENLGISISEPLPSLFTFNSPSSYLNPLMGTSLKNVRVKILGTNFNFEGPILITHWGFSGPAILKLSAFAAKELASKQYQFNISINWLPQFTDEKLKIFLLDYIKKNPKKQVQNCPFDEISNRLWTALLENLTISPNQIWSEINHKNLNKLINELVNSIFEINGKTTFKEEFVTCGGVKLSEINPNTLASNLYKNLYFAGEVLDIDGITGGYNFQAAWTTGYLAGQLLGI